MAEETAQRARETRFFFGEKRALSARRANYFFGEKKRNSRHRRNRTERERDELLERIILLRCEKTNAHLSSPTS